LALRDAAHAERLDQLVHRACGDALHIGFLDNGGECLLGQPPWLQEAGKVAALSQLRNAQLHRAGARLPIAVAIAVAAVNPLRAAFAKDSSRSPLEIGR